MSLHNHRPPATGHPRGEEAQQHHRRAALTDCRDGDSIDFGNPSPHVPAPVEWAAASGYAVTARGRIPAEIQEAFDAAH
jgi:hypothetical protein